MKTWTNYWKFEKNKLSIWKNNTENWKKIVENLKKKS